MTALAKNDNHMAPRVPPSHVPAQNVFSEIFAPKTREEAVALCKQLANESWVPKSYRCNPMFVAIALEFGARFGLSPMASLMNIAMVNGKVALFGDMALAVCRKSDPRMHYNEEYHFSGEGPKRICVGCTVSVQRSGCEPHVESFMRADAERANLINKEGTWRTYPQRMYMARARGFALRTMYPDVLAGYITTEEANDMMTDERQSKPAPAPAKLKPHPATVVDAYDAPHDADSGRLEAFGLAEFVGMIEDASTVRELESVAQAHGKQLSDNDKALAKAPYRRRLELLKKEAETIVNGIRANEERESQTQKMAEKLNAADVPLPDESDIPLPDDLWPKEDG